MMARPTDQALAVPAEPSYTVSALTGVDPSRIHELKCWPEFFQAIRDGHKRHELRRNDRDFRVGDGLLLREYDPETGQYSGREIVVYVTYSTKDDNPCALSAFGLKEGFCILSIASAIETRSAETERLSPKGESAPGRPNDGASA